jgi:hypothetical protein
MDRLAVKRRALVEVGEQRPARARDGSAVSVAS